MQYSINSHSIKDSTIELPLSKSIANRALILNALSKEGKTLSLSSLCDDTRVMIEALSESSSDKNIGAAGTAMRFLTAYYSQLPGSWTITGSERMRQRPIKILVEALRECGAEIGYLEKEGFPPLAIKGRQLKGGSITLDGGVSSQYISALMMIAPLMTEGLEIDLINRVISEPYIEMTRNMLRCYGVESSRADNKIIINRQAIRKSDITIEADWSAASYWYEIVSLDQKAKIKLIGLNKESVQGDAKLAEYFTQLGVETTFEKDGVLLTPSGRFSSKIEFDLKSEPDIAQTIAVACAVNEIPFRLTGLETLRIKETDRIQALQNELLKLGYVVEAEGDQALLWSGEKTIAKDRPEIDTYDDHRMAMAFAPACLKKGEIVINEPLVVTKSYPGYYDSLKKTGFDVNQLGD